MPDPQTVLGSPDLVERKAFLTALQLADSFFPTGMYAHSHGLEAMINRGLVDTVDDIEDFLTEQMIWSLLPSDAVALSNAHVAAQDGDLELIVQIDRTLSALRLPSELRGASEQLGGRLLSETTSFRAHRIHADYSAMVLNRKSPGNGAVALGVIAQVANLSAEQAVLMLCHGHAVSILGSAMRIFPMSHSDAQSVLRRLHRMLVHAIDDIGGRSWREMTSFTPALDVLSMCHETDDLKLFAS